MKNFRKLISGLTAFAMTAAMFAGLGISANAEELSITSSESVYVDRANPDTNYNGADQTALKSLYTQFRDWAVNNATGTMNFRGESSSMPLWKFDISSVPTDEKIIEAKVTLTITETGDSKYANSMRIVGYNGSWDASALTYNTLTNNGGNNLTAIPGTVSGAGSFQPLNTTTDLSTGTSFPETITADATNYLNSAIEAGNTSLSIAVAENSTRTVYFATSATLDIVTSAAELYSVSLNTAPLAKVTVGDNTYYSDKNGNADLGKYIEGTVLSYSVEKNGYTSVTNGQITVGTEDISVDAPISLTNEDVLYYEDYATSGVADGGTTLMGLQRYKDGKLQIWAPDTVAISGVTGAELYTIKISGYTAYASNPGDRSRTKSIAFMDGATKVFSIDTVLSNADVTAKLSTSETTVDIPVSGDIELTVGKGQLAGKIGDTAINVAASSAITKIDSIVFAGNGDVYLTTALGAIEITKPDASYLAVSGVSAVAKNVSETVTKQYEYSYAYVAPDEAFTWEVSGVDGVTIDQNGVLSVPASAETGTAVITLTSTEGKNASYSVKIGDPTYVIADATGSSTVVDTSVFAENAAITGYLVTTATADGTLVKQGTVDAADSVTVDTTGADKVEISPVYFHDNVGNAGAGITFEGIFADGSYNFVFTKAYSDRSDIFVNGYMVGNNVCQDGPGRTMTADDLIYNANDVIVDCGEIGISMEDCVGGHEANAFNLTSVKFSKAPSIINRVPKVYVIGDSLVASYYGTISDILGSSRTGWGQVIENYFTDDVEVINLANSGATTESLYATAYPGVLHNAIAGDYLIFESGYNDQGKTNPTDMTATGVEMVNALKAKGVTTIAVSPNASRHDLKSSLKYGYVMGDIAEATDSIFVDLSALSYSFFEDLYGTTTADADSVVISADYNEDGTLASAALATVAEGDVIDLKAADKVFVWDAVDSANGSSAMVPAGCTTVVDGTAVGSNYGLDKVDSSDNGLHSSYVGAMKYAEIVAQGMKDAGVPFINTDYSYTFTDTEGNVITTQVK